MSTLHEAPFNNSKIEQDDNLKLVEIPPFEDAGDIESRFSAIVKALAAGKDIDNDFHGIGRGHIAVSLDETPNGTVVELMLASNENQEGFYFKGSEDSDGSVVDITLKKESFGVPIEAKYTDIRDKKVPEDVSKLATQLAEDLRDEVVKELEQNELDDHTGRAIVEALSTSEEAHKPTEHRKKGLGHAALKWLGRSAKKSA